VARRVEIELTSVRDDGTWTWRVAGAKQPRGVVAGDLLPSGAKVGDVLRVEADVEMEGTTILAVLPPETKRPEPERLELRREEAPVPGVTTALVRRDADKRVRTRPSPSRARARPEEPSAERPSRAPARPPRRDRGAGSEEAPVAVEEKAPSAPPTSRPHRLVPQHKHRRAVLDSLAPEEKAVAERLLSGGIPALRRALDEERSKAAAAGRPAVPAEGVLNLAEDLLPRLKAAEWKDRAEAATEQIDEVSLRDLRALVGGAESAARDDETRLLAGAIRDALARRQSQARDEWLAGISSCLDENKVMRALRHSARPPDPRTRLPAAVAARLAEAAGSAMSADTPSERWAGLLEAVLASPVRRSVKPGGLPADTDGGVLSAARQAAGKIPALARLLGIQMPPPPGPPRTVVPEPRSRRTYGPRMVRPPTPPPAPHETAS